MNGTAAVANAAHGPECRYAVAYSAGAAVTANDPAMSMISVAVVPDCPVPPQSEWSSTVDSTAKRASRAVRPHMPPYNIEHTIRAT